MYRIARFIARPIVRFFSLLRATRNFKLRKSLLENRVVSPVPFFRCEVNVLASFAFKSYKSNEDLPKETGGRKAENTEIPANGIGVQNARTCPGGSASRRGHQYIDAGVLTRAYMRSWLRRTEAESIPSAGAGVRTETKGREKRGVSKFKGRRDCFDPYQFLKRQPSFRRGGRVDFLEFAGKIVSDRYDSIVTHEDARANRDVNLPTITYPPKIANRSPTFSLR